MIKVLLIEDELDLAEITIETLSLYEFKVYHAPSAEEGKALFFKIQPHILIVDVLIPGHNGYEFVKEIRKFNTAVPIVFITAKTQLTDLLKGFNAGANDYLKKPFRYEELIARMKALLRLPGPVIVRPHRHRFTIGQYVFDTETQELASNLLRYRLSFKETELLKRLCEDMSTMVAREKLLLELWGDDNYFTSRNLNVLITRLRKTCRRSWCADY